MGRRKAGTTRFTEANTTDAAHDLARIQAGSSLGRKIIAKSTRQDRERVLQSWNEFIRLRFAQEGSSYGDDIWTWLAGDDVQKRNYAVSVCQLFLEDFVRASKREVLVWGLDERRSQQCLTCVTSVNTTWKTLIAAAQERILDKLAMTTGKVLQISRQQGPIGAADDGIVAQVTKWIGTSLKAQYRMTTDSEYEKVAATCKDMELLLRTLWERADDIPMTRLNRVTTHIYLLILYVSGCRPGMLEDIRWEDCQLYLLRDPTYSNRSRLFLDLKLRFNKLKKDSVLLPSDRKSFTFSLTLMPTPLLDLTHLFAAWAIHDGALARNFTSISEILKEVPHDSSDKMIIQWKKELQNQRPWKMSCETFRRHFKRLCLVAGLKSPPRPYFLRIGAGANLEDKGLPASLVCQILSHTAKVHNQSYQSLRTRHDIQSAAFGELAGDSQQLYQYLGHAWKDFDTNAPIYMTCTQSQEIEQRHDTKAHIQKINELRKLRAPQKDMQMEQDRLAQHKKRLEELAILARREEYFTQKTTRSQLGPPTPTSENPEEEVTWPRKHAHLDLERLMRAWAPGTNFDTDAQQRTIAADAWLRHYMAATDSEIRRPAGGSRAETAPTISVANISVSAEVVEGCRASIGIQEVETSATLLSIPSGKASKCIICSKLFIRRAELTRHVTLSHKASLQHAFPCPACQQITSSPSEFSNHVERFHGKQYAPQFRTAAPAISVAAQVKGQTAPLVSCAICTSDFRTGSHKFFSSHFNPRHSRETDLLDRRLDCPDCTDIRGLDVDAWVVHLAARHGISKAERCPFCNRFFQSQGISPHIHRSHFNSASGSLSCSICLRRHGIVVPLYDYASWRVHSLAAGHLANSTSNSPSESLGSRKRPQAAHDPLEDISGAITAYKRLRVGNNGASPPSASYRILNKPLLANHVAEGIDHAKRTEAVQPSGSPDARPFDIAIDQSVDEISSSASPHSPSGSVDLIDPALWRDWNRNSAESPLSPDNIKKSTTDRVVPRSGGSAVRRSSRKKSAGSTVCTRPVTITDFPILDCIIVKA